jgi:Cu/Ag efflux protein CusF
VVLALLVVAGVVYYTQTRPKPVQTPGPAPAPAQAYTVRGRITDLPDPAHPASGLQIQHEEIKDFLRKDGTRGMASMTMDFPVAPGVSLEGLSANDPVEFTFEVDWPRYQVTSITRLPPETVLEFDAPPAR